MNQQDKEQFSKALVESSFIFPRDITKPLLKIYFEALEEFGINEVYAAIKKHNANATFFPKPGDIRAIININKPKIEDKALLAWNHIERSISKLGGYRSLTLTDGVSAKSLDSVGGWQRICAMSYKELEFKKRDFIKTYLATAPTSDNLLPIKMNGLHDLAKLENKE